MFSILPIAKEVFTGVETICAYIKALESLSALVGALFTSAKHLPPWRCIRSVLVPGLSGLGSSFRSGGFDLWQTCVQYFMYCQEVLKGVETSCAYINALESL